MRSKTSCFDKTIYTKTLRRFWPVWFGGAGLWFLLLPMYFFNWINEPNRHVLNLRYRLVTSMTVEMHVVWFLFSLCAAMAVFAWLYNARSVGFTASLPVNRKTLFWSGYLAGATMLVSTLVFTGGLMLILSLCFGGGAGDLIGLWMLESLLDIIGFYGFACLCAMLTGNLVVMPLCALALEFAAVVVEALVQYLMNASLFGYRSSGGKLSYASPVWALCEHTGYRAVTDENGLVTDYVFSGMGLVLLYAVLGVLFTLLALRLLQERRMETAGDTVAIAVLKPVFRWCMAVGCALLLSVIIFDLSLQGTIVKGGVLALLLFLLVLGGLIGWFGADMIIQKRFRVFTLHTKGAVLLCGILLAFGLSLGFDPLGVEKKLPAREKFDSVVVNAAGSSAEFREEPSFQQVLKLQKSIISNKALHEEKYHQECRYLSLSFRKDGVEVFSRDYYLAATPEEQGDRNSDLRFAERVLNLPEAMLARKKMEVPVTENNIFNATLTQWQYHYPDEASRKYAYTTNDTEDIADASERYFGACRDFRAGVVNLSAAEAYELYTECILPDLEEGTLGRIYLVEDEAYARTFYNIRIELAVGERRADGGNRTSFFYTMPTVNSRRTNEWLEDHGVVLETYWDYLGSVDSQNVLENGVGEPELAIETWGY